jgi:hypothetical protein
MKWYFSIRFLAVPLAFIIYFTFIMAVRGKKFYELKSDIIISCFFIGVWGLLYYFLFL